MSNYGNISKIIDAEKEQSKMIKRYGRCMSCNTIISTLLLKDDDKKYFNREILKCPICFESIKMEES